ncbi:MAG: NeuD/PglB/VioB family sugar acetyltransferase [Burkholderiales bacterium]|nr:NeuD/PglB/VioB family sugar acetyltransferase [Burkholderiales bacterium]
MSAQARDQARDPARVQARDEPSNQPSDQARKRAALWILGAGGHGRVVADAAAASGRFAEIVFFDDDATLGPQVGRWPVRGNSQAFIAAAAPDKPDSDAAPPERHIGIGDNQRRDQWARRCESQGLALATVAHPAAVVSIDAVLAPGCFVAAGAVVAPGAELGVAVVVNHGASVDHDGRIGRAAHIGPGAHLGGTVTVGELAWIGLGAAVRHGARIGARAMVGAGAVVVADVADEARVVGNPARSLPDPFGNQGPLRA